MKQHMIFFDIDGTLLDDEQGIVPESTVRALHQARENGHLLFICTGRCQAIWPSDILDIGFDGVVGGCGTHIVYHGEELLHAVIEPDLRNEIVADLRKYHIDGILESKHNSYFRKDCWMPGHFQRIVRSFGMMMSWCLTKWRCGLMTAVIWPHLRQSMRTVFLLSCAILPFMRLCRKSIQKRPESSFCAGSWALTEKIR